MTIDHRETRPQLSVNQSAVQACSGCTDETLDAAPLIRGALADESVDKPDSVPTAYGRGRSSICDCCCQQPGAIYPETRASSPQSSPQTRVRVLLILLPVGFTEPPQSPGVLVVSYTAVSPLPPLRGAVCFLWHCPAGHPGWALPTTVLCGVRTFLGRPEGPPRSPDRLVRRSR
jgi:hypothetical protein